MKKLVINIQKQFNKMQATGKLFRSSLSGDEIWDIYLKGFSSENDPVFRDPNSSVHNCNHCKNFIRRYGNIISLDKDLNIMTIFDVNTSEEYQKSCDNISKAIKKSVIEDIFVDSLSDLCSMKYCNHIETDTYPLGIPKNVKRYTKEEAQKYGVVKANELKEFNHLSLIIQKEFIITSDISIPQKMGLLRDKFKVFKRGMETISTDTLETVLDLIDEDIIKDSKQFETPVKEFLDYKKEYDKVSNSKKDLWCWKYSDNMHALFRNSLIGVLCTEIEESGGELEIPCQNWNKRVDPINYKRAKSPITKKQKEEANKWVVENGYEESFNRRCATIEDIKVSEIVHINSINKDIKKVSIFDSIDIPEEIKIDKKNLTEINIEDFISDVLPKVSSVEAYLESKHSNNMVTLTTSCDKDSKNILKWGNNFSWTYAGNIAGKSLIKDAVKERGGATEGDLNIRLHFPNTISDYDLHIKEPNYRIFYSNRRRLSPNGGMLDLDAQGCDGDYSPELRVENVIYKNKSTMMDGEYQVIVNNYNQRDSNHGFNLEIELEGNIYIFNYNKPITQSGNVILANIIKSGNTLSIKPVLPIYKEVSKDIYGLKTLLFHPVSLLCFSPNFWEDNVGNKHYFFFIKDAKAPNKIRSFHNDHMRRELLDHRKVLDVLGSTCLVDSIDNQLSGLGFNETIREELIVRITIGNKKRLLKIKF